VARPRGVRGDGSPRERGVPGGRPPGSALRAAFTPGVLIAGAFGYGGSVMVQNAGIGRTSVTHAALLIGAVPVLVAIIAAVWYRAVARPVAWFGFAVSLGGVGLITTGSGGGGATMAGDGLVLASLLLSAMVTVAQGRLLAGRDPIAVTAVQFLGATLGSLPIAAVSEGVPAAPAGAGVVLAVVALALAGTLLPFTLFAFGQSRVSAEVAGAFLNLEPLVGAIAGAVVFGDPVGLVQAGGGAAILAGIALSSLPLIAGRRVARRAALVVAADAAADTSAAAATAAPAQGAGAQGAGVTASEGACEEAGTGVAQTTEVPWARGRWRTYESGAVHQRVCTAPLSYPREPAHQRRNGVFVLVRGSKFGTGVGGGVTPGLAHPGSERTRPGGRVAGRMTGRPPARGRGRRTDEPGRRAKGRETNAGGGLGGSGRRATGGRGRSWPGASRGRSAAGR
jgi:O-acetylserine/cysteine efflux transporter